jgi:Na+/alanine symporter
VGKENLKTSKSAKTVRDIVAGALAATGRVFLFFGLVCTLLALAVFCMDTFSNGPSVAETIASQPAAAYRDPTLAQVLLVVLAGLAAFAGIGYMFYTVNRWVRYAIELIAKHTKQSLVMLEVSLTFMMYALGAALLSAMFQDHMSVVLAVCGTGAVIALSCFMAAHFMTFQKSTFKTKV